MIKSKIGKEITSIYTRDGKEIIEVRDNQNNIVYSTIDEISGVPPLSFMSHGGYLQDCRIYGNTVQNGTPSPEVPADVVGCGVRTENLFSGEFSQFNNVGGTGNIYAYFYIPEDFTLTLIAKDTHTIPSNVYLGITKDGGQATGGFTWAILQRVDVTEGDIFTVESSINGYHYVSMYRKDASALTHYYIMLNLGSTALPYEPYGYKIPISSGGKNLLDESASSDADATHINYNKDAPIILTAGQTYTLSCNTVCNGLYIRSAADDSNLASANNSNTLTYAPQVNVRAYCRVWNSNGITNLNPMLNCGSTQLPYEPYNRTTTPVYLGEVPTTRKIKKLVLTGDEPFFRDREREGSWRFYSDALISAKDDAAICSHFENIGAGGVNNSDNIGFCLFYKAQFGCRCPKSIATTVADFKSYLAAQYAAGTPVTVWYVLDEPETGIVNEPIQKIGDYSDELSIADIPTINGINTISADTIVQPSEMYIKGKIKSIT